MTIERSLVARTHATTTGINTMYAATSRQHFQKWILDGVFCFVYGQEEKNKNIKLEQSNNNETETSIDNIHVLSEDERNIIP